MPRSLPRPAAKGLTVIVKSVVDALCGSEQQKIPGRGYVVPATGELVDWVDARNPAMWLGDEEED